MNQSANKVTNVTVLFQSPLMRGALLLLLLTLGLRPLILGVVKLHEASGNRPAVRTARTERIAELEEKNRRLEKRRSSLAPSIWPVPAHLAEHLAEEADAGRRDDAERNRLIGDIGFVQHQIHSEQNKIKRSEKAADEVPFMIGMVAMGLVIWSGSFLLVFRWIPRSRRRLAIVDIGSGSRAK